MKDVIAYIDDRADEMVSLLGRLVDIDSGTRDKAGVDRIGELLMERLQLLGFEVERIRQQEYGDHVLGRKVGNSGRCVLFVGHMDTVFPAGTAAARPFRIEGPRAYGPGVLDMKGGIVCLLYALEALQATGHVAYEALGMRVVFNADEEVLSPTSRPVIENQALDAQMVCVFEPARPGGEYVIRRKGVGKYYLTVNGRAAHAGAQPERGRSAIAEMAHKVVALHALNDYEAGTTVNVGVVQGGERSNIVADRAYAEVDVRAVDVESGRRLDQAVREIVDRNVIPDTTAELTGGIVFPPMEPTPQTERLFAALQEAGRQIGLEVRAIATGGGSDGNYAAQFAPTIDGMGPQGSEAHSEREYIEIGSLAERAKAAALFLAGVCS
jgi:glutamate carboxypeptidase